jgi:pimeloyl-ACP methyl ester carboxylesterase
MLYFNGFSLQNEEKYFSDILMDSELCVAGFSYGAQKAFEYVYKSKERIDRLILLSPAFFQTEKPSFVRTQLRYFEAGQEAYVKQFLSNVANPADVDLSNNLKVGTKEDLEALLTYVWNEEKIKEVLARGTVIEVFFGKEDKILEVQKAFDFFAPFTTVYFMKNAGHLLGER